MQGYMYDPNQLIQMGQINQLNTVYPYMNYGQPYIDYNMQDPNKQDIQGGVINQVDNNINYGNSSTKS